MNLVDLLPDQINKLSSGDREVFDRIFRIYEAQGGLEIPKPMQKWVKDTFGSLAAVKHQRFIKITNKVTYEGSIFNELRTSRPAVADSGF